MASAKSLGTLIEVARERSDKAAQELGEAVRLASATKEKLELILQYRDDYANRFESGLFRGLSGLEYSNFLSFLAKLEAAAERQRETVHDAEVQVEAQRLAWQATVRRHESLATLVRRMDREERKREDRRDQKLMDENAARLSIPRKRL
jgi:flagellar FliJ protein